MKNEITIQDKDGNIIGEYYIETNIQIEPRKKKGEAPIRIWFDDAGGSRKTGHNKEDVEHEMKIGEDKKGNDITMLVWGNPRIKVDASNARIPVSLNWNPEILLKGNLKSKGEKSIKNAGIWDDLIIFIRNNLDILFECWNDGGTEDAVNKLERKLISRGVIRKKKTRES